MDLTQTFKDELKEIVKFPWQPSKDLLYLGLLRLGNTRIGSENLYQNC